MFKLKDQQLTIDDVHNIYRQLIRGYKLIHASGYIHSDIKPENILIDWNADGEIEAVLCDLDLYEIKRARNGYEYIEEKGKIRCTDMYCTQEFQEIVNGD